MNDLTASTTTTPPPPGMCFNPPPVHLMAKSMLVTLCVKGLDSKRDETVRITLKYVCMRARTRVYACVRARACVRACVQGRCCRLSPILRPWLSTRGRKQAATAAPCTCTGHCIAPKPD